MKKLLALALVLAMAFSLVACSGGDTASEPANTNTEVVATGETEEVVINGITYNKATDMTQDKITLTYFHFDQDETVQYLANRFMEIYPNIKVITEYEPVGSANDTLLTLVAAGKTPDAVMISDADFALNNFLLQDISPYWNADKETQNLADTVNAAGLGTFMTSKRYAVPVKFFPTMMCADLSVFRTLNIDIPEQNWTWDEMINIIKSAKRDGSVDGTAYYGLGYYNRLDSLYGIASSQDIIGEFGFNGQTFNLGMWAVGEQQFSDLKLGGYVAPQRGVVAEEDALEDWLGDIDAWYGLSGHVALMSEAYWTYQNLWNTEEIKNNYPNLDIVPYVIPAVSAEDATKDHHAIATIDFGGVTSSCQHPREAYELLKFMSFGVDGWKTRLELYSDENYVNASGIALKHDSMPAPITKNQEIWDAYIKMYCEGMDEEHVLRWTNYFESVMQPIPYGWVSIAGYWTYCDQYFNSIGIHELVDKGTNKAADFADEATRKANYFHAAAMLDYFGPNALNVLSAEEVATYEQLKADNS